MKMHEIRHCLHALANQIGGVDGAIIHYLAEETRRRSPVRRAPRQKYSRLSQQQLTAFFAAHPNADYMTAANAFNSNIGRVSEALTGYRT